VESLYIDIDEFRLQRGVKWKKVREDLCQKRGLTVGPEETGLSWIGGEKRGVTSTSWPTLCGTFSCSSTSSLKKQGKGGGGKRELEHGEEES